MRRVGLAGLVAMLLTAVAAPVAQALPVLADADAADLAATLATATKAQGVCYGWAVSVNDSSGGPTGVDAGSDKGAGMRVDQSCPKWVELQGSVDFTCESCESEDSAGATVVANFPGAPTTADLSALGFTGSRLTADDNDVVLTNMVGALPLVTASNGAAAAVPTAAPEAADTPGAGDVATGTPSTPDWLREHWLGLAFFVLLIGGGTLWLISLLSAGRPMNLNPTE